MWMSGKGTRCNWRDVPRKQQLTRQRLPGFRAWSSDRAFR
jgi:hypothetical protein